MQILLMVGIELGPFKALAALVRHSKLVIIHPLALQESPQIRTSMHYFLNKYLDGISGARRAAYDYIHMLGSF